MVSTLLKRPLAAVAALLLALPVSPARADFTIDGPVTFDSTFSHVGSKVSAIPTPVANTYAATTGNDANNCLSVPTACLTVQRAADVAMSQVTFTGQAVQVNVGAGTFTKGVIINGAMPGGGTGAIPAVLSLVGAGSGSTTLGVTDTATCSGVQALRGAMVSVAAMTISTSCTGGSGLWAQLGSLIEVVPGDVVLGAAPIAKMFAQSNSVIVLNPLNSGNQLTFSGNGQYAVLAADNSSIRWFGGGFVTLSGGPVFSVAFIDAINNSTVKTGALTFAGTASGPRYLLGENSSIDVDQGTAALPGTQGAVGLGAVVFQQGTISQACTPPAGGGGSCAVTAAPTGIGGAGAATAINGADYAGTVTMTAGATPGSNGVIYAAPYSQMSFCTVSINQGGTGAWNARATVFGQYGNFSGSFALQFQWDNNAVDLVNGSTYMLNYACR